MTQATDRRCIDASLFGRVRSGWESLHCRQIQPPDPEGAATGVITTVAGNGDDNFYGDNGPATSAALWSPLGIAIDSAGNIFIADTYNGRIRRVTAATGVITTVAGDGSFRYSGDNGPAVSATLNSPTGLAIDAAGNLIIVDFWNERIRAIRWPLR
jgi:DNA-binding beta-propeller fold protein YncE